MEKIPPSKLALFVAENVFNFKSAGWNIETEERKLPLAEIFWKHPSNFFILLFQFNAMHRRVCAV